jgi:hypothetical protein
MGLLYLMIMKSRELRWVADLTRASNTRKPYTVFVGKSLEKGSCGTPRGGGMGGGDDDGFGDRDSRK